jgi:uncharacterized membrane-anchored protein
MSKRFFVVLAILFQITAVAVIAVSKEWILGNGRDIILQTAPVDPRDIFRGDYVRLDYSISKVPVSQLDADIIENGLRKGQKVYLSLKEHSIGIFQGILLTTSPPDNSHYLKGYVTSHWPFRNYSKFKNDERIFQSPVYVKYGIEQYYVEQGHGKDIEQIRGRNNGYQVPMLMHIAVSDSGEALVRSFEWANIAMKTELMLDSERDANDPETSAIVTFTLLNRGTESITLPLKSGNCSFTIVPDSATPDAHKISFHRPSCADAGTVERTIKPDEELSLSFNLNMPDWYVNYKNAETPMGKLPWNYRFRIVYDDRMPGDINALIVSSAFHGRGTID